MTAPGPRAGQKVLSLRSLPSAARPSAPELRVNAHGFSLHAAVRWGTDQRQELEQLCRYITRPAIANERLERNRAGQVVLQLKSPYKDGTTHIVMEPLEFMERLAALVPRPRLHLIRFHGVLAPNAKLRGKIVPAAAKPAIETSRTLPQLPSIACEKAMIPSHETNTLLPVKGPIKPVESSAMFLVCP